MTKRGSQSDPNAPFAASLQLQSEGNASDRTASTSRSEQDRPEVLGNAAPDWVKPLLVVESVAISRTQNDAIIALVKCLTAMFPASSVRCGVGSSRLKRFYDARLGWLGPSSDLFQSTAEDWNDDSHTLPTGAPTTEQRKVPRPSAQSIRLNIDDTVGIGRCVLLIDGPDLRDSDRTWLRRTLPSLRTLFWQRTGGFLEHATRSLANSGMTTRIYLGLAALALLLLSIWPVSYRVRCAAVVRPSNSRMVAAPFAATLSETFVEPGVTVQAGTPLVSLDGRPLRLELESVEAQIGQAAKERDIALVGGRIGESQQAALRIRELSRQRDLITDRLSRLTVISPIDGVVVAGDLKRSVGMPLEIGQPIFEIAPLDEMTIELEIPEYEVGHVDPHAYTRINLNARAGGPIEAEIDQLYPAAEVRDDRNVFVARIDIENDEGTLRPGMRGDAIAYGPLRPWMWSHVRTGWEKVLWWVGF